MAYARTPGPLTVGPFLDAWEIELRAGLWVGAPPDLLDRLKEDYLHTDASEEECASVIAAAEAAHPALVARLRAEEAGWHDPTDCDRLDAAFAALGAEGVACHLRGLTLEDAHAAAALVTPADAWGLCLVHQGDVLDALRGDGLLLAFDVAGDGPGGPEARAAVGARVVARLRAHGLPADWTGDPSDRIWVRPFAWRRRRWTAPRPVAVAASAPRPWAGRLAPRVDVSAAALAPYIQPVVARYSTSAFDPEFALVMRGVWRSLGGEWGQVAHAGLPHTFVPAGEETTLTARDALANLEPTAAAALRAEARGRRGGDAPPDGAEAPAPMAPAAPEGAEAPAPMAPAAPAALPASRGRPLLGVALAGLGPLLAAGLSDALPGAQAGLAGGALSGLLLVAPAATASAGPRARLWVVSAVAVGAVLGGMAGAAWLG